MIWPMAPAPKKTLYQILGVPRDANALDIGMAHDRRVRELDRTVHPDPSEAALVQQAWEILSDPKRRASYDSQLITAAERSAAAEQATPDLEIGGEEEDAPKPKVPRIAIVVAVVVGIAALFFALRSETPKAPEPVAETPKPSPAPPPPPPRARTPAELVAQVSNAGGPLLSFSMSGAATPLGMALAIDAGAMVTTCHGIPAGSKLVVRVGKEQHPADLTVTDEALDLCRLAVTGFGKAPLELSPDEPKAGDSVFAVTTDAKGEIKAVEGTIKSLRKVPAGKVLELSIPIPASGSGGAVLDAQGRLVGIATVPHPYGPGAVALPASWIAQMRSRAVPAKQ
jgi:S1-C subfamily serine protease